MDEMEGGAGAAAAAARYWCHFCSQMVNPVMEVEMIKCPLCERGFVEELGSAVSSPSVENNNPFPDDYFFGGGDGGPEFESDRALSLWAPILLGMMSNPRRRRRFRRRLEYADEDDDEDDSERNNSVQHEGQTDRELESIIRRRRSSATILQLLHGIRAGMLTESDNPASDNRDGNGDTADIRDRERVILINPFNQTIIVQGGSYESTNSQNQGRNPIGSLGDYFIGPGLDLLLQHLAENDPNRYGTPPAQKEAVEAMPTVKVEENLQCSVCLDDFEIGSEAKEMPCKHKFHCGCIIPWLEIHSSCPVCRHQLPADESKLDSDGFRNNSNGGSNDTGESNNNGGSSNGGGMGEDGGGDWDGRNGNGRRFSVPLPWPFNIFSSSGSGGDGNNSSSTPSSSSSAAAAANASSRNGSQSHTDEN
ncbi:E3 ubiquitin-protein ligase SIRP1-like [Diospyros lotus]|uniref:E3 ubiquitin-protein ligase SIRP1-like n=1 Tax=Diospyros lotus TaxID=55363 RepID=UPI002252EB54|nr:E3 ubiquitin-protein ligase SIRP1-like [Diospyros lotus]XP_052200119.1 E3 ubiquitin-protein ligase SIRP1-like [Diospyros lotus]XP_052200127.1 E3 ubiquitin-protein ligase SIRP1-like [Diospyros lotus]